MAIVTGAGRSIGRVIAHTLARMPWSEYRVRTGAAVVVSGRFNRAQLDAVVDEIETAKRWPAIADDADARFLPERRLTRPQFSSIFSAAMKASWGSPPGRIGACASCPSASPALQQLALARNVAAVALGEHALPDESHGCRSKNNLGDAQHRAEASALDSTQYEYGACWEGRSKPHMWQADSSSSP